MLGAGRRAGLEARIEIAVITRLDALQGVVVCVGEELEACGLRIETEDAERGGTLLAGGEVEREAFERRRAVRGREDRSTR